MTLKALDGSRDLPALPASWNDALSPSLGFNNCGPLSTRKRGDDLSTPVPHPAPSVPGPQCDQLLLIISVSTSVPFLHRYLPCLLSPSQPSCSLAVLCGRNPSLSSGSLVTARDLGPCLCSLLLVLWRQARCIPCLQLYRECLAGIEWARG